MLPFGVSSEALPEDSEILRNTRRGVFFFISNHPGNAKEIYLMYKERVEIEQRFDYMKQHSVCRKPIKAENNAAIYVQSFINHLALLCFYKVAEGNRGVRPEGQVLSRGNNR